MTTGAVMPQDLRAAFQYLHDEIVWIHAKWQMYRQVYGSEQLRVDLLNEFAPVFFRICQDALLDDILISINRLLDPPSMSGRANLSVKRLVDMASPQDPRLAVQLMECLSEIESSCESFRTVRNRRLGHNDLQTCLSTSEPLPGVSRQMVEHALADIRTLMNTVSAHFDGSTSHFWLAPPEGIGGDVLINNLERLRRYRRLHGELPPLSGEHPDK